LKYHQIRGCRVDEFPAKRCKREDDGVEGTYSYELECYLKDLPATVCCAEELPTQAAVTVVVAAVDVVGLDLRRTVVVLRFVDDQDVGETAVIRFWCASQRIKKFGGSHEGKVKRHPVTSAMVARLRIDDERAGPRSLPIQTYKQSWISTAATTTVTAA
jgi:hypothetical protein